MVDNLRQLDRRTILKTLGAGSMVALAGCGSSDDGDGGDAGADDSDTSDGNENGGSDDGNGDMNGEEEQVPGADVLGGPDDLQSAATVQARTLESDQGAGQNVFSPAVVWVEAGATITWENASGSHSATAYHPNNDRPMRVPTAAASFDSGVMSDGDSFEHTFEEPGVYNYYCSPHEGLGMVGLVVVSEATPGPGTEPVEEVESGAAVDGLERLLSLANIDVEETASTYAWNDATWDSYWYSLYNMSTVITLSGNGITFPANEQQREQFQQRFPAIVEAANADQPPVIEPNLNMAPFTEGDPSFTEQPVLDAGDGRPDARTLTWDPSASSMTVSPSSLGWTHLKGITWAKNFEQHADILPPGLAPLFRAMVLSTMAQVGTAFALVPEQGGNFRLNDDNLLLGSAFRPGEGLVDETPQPRHHSAMLWFLSNLNSLAQGGWFGYENPEPLIPAENIQMLTNGIGQTTMNAVDPAGIENTRLAGELLGAVGWFGTQTNQDRLRTAAAEYADGLAGRIEANLDDNGRVDSGAANQAATQGVAGQGLAWASQIDGVDYTDMADEVLGYLQEALFDAEAGVYASGTDDETYRYTPRDVGDITGGVNAANAVLDRSDIQSQYATFFNQTLNRGRLQRAERPQSREENAEYTLPLPPMAGGEFGQAAVYNAEVAYDATADEWTVTDDTFDTEQSLYLANQEIWISQWGGDFYQGSGVPGETDALE